MLAFVSIWSMCSLARCDGKSFRLAIYLFAMKHQSHKNGRTQVRSSPRVQPITLIPLLYMMNWLPHNLFASFLVKENVSKVTFPWAHMSPWPLSLCRLSHHVVACKYPSQFIHDPSFFRCFTILRVAQFSNHEFGLLPKHVMSSMHKNYSGKSCMPLVCIMYNCYNHNCMGV